LKQMKLTTSIPLATLVASAVAGTTLFSWLRDGPGGAAVELEGQDIARGETDAYDSHGYDRHGFDRYGWHVDWGPCTGPGWPAPAPSIPSSQTHGTSDPSAGSP
jgi:hypothetical protein